MCLCDVQCLVDVVIGNRVMQYGSVITLTAIDVPVSCITMSFNCKTLTLHHCITVV